MICEMCESINDGSYGSGRFCNKKCASGFSTKAKRLEINKKVGIKLKGIIQPHLIPFKKGFDPNRFPIWEHANRQTLENGLHLARQTVQKEQDSRPFENKSFRQRYTFLLKKQEGKCLFCLCSDWMNKSLKLQYDHIDGNPSNNLESNSRLLCPNCHSQTDTYCKGHKVNKINKTDNEYIEALKSSKSIREALLSLGLTAKGYNYNRCYKLMAENNITFNASMA